MEQQKELLGDLLQTTSELVHGKCKDLTQFLQGLVELSKCGDDAKGQTDETILSEIMADYDDKYKELVKMIEGSK